MWGCDIMFKFSFFFGLVGKLGLYLEKLFVGLFVR